MVNTISPLYSLSIVNILLHLFFSLFLCLCLSLSQFSSVSQLCPTLCDPMDCSMQGFPVYHQLPELAQTHVHWVVMPSNHLILCHPLLSPSILPSIRVFSNDSVLHIRWPKYWSFSFNISPSNEYSGLISFRTDWFDLLASKGLSRKSLLQHHSSKPSILQCSAFLLFFFFKFTILYWFCHTST